MGDPSPPPPAPPGRVTHCTLPFLCRIFWPQRKVTFLPSDTSRVLVLGGGAVAATVGKGNSAREGGGAGQHPAPPAPPRPARPGLGPAAP